MVLIFEKTAPVKRVTKNEGAVQIEVSFEVRSILFAFWSIWFVSSVSFIWFVWRDDSLREWKRVLDRLGMEMTSAL
jgi:hypothetical protein